jgi:hypothetical protein
LPRRAARPRAIEFSRHHAEAGPIDSGPMIDLHLLCARGADPS